MKFWQVLDIFRDEKDLLREAFKNEAWLDYQNNYNNIDDIVKYQRRDILDKEVDPLLLNEIIRKSKKIIYYAQAVNKIYSYPVNIDYMEVSIEKAVLLFDHDKVEEVFEKTEAIAKRI